MSVAERFTRMSEEAKEKFVEDTLGWLLKLTDNPKGAAKIFKNVGKEKLTPEQEKTVNTLVVAFLYSLKDEFRYQWAGLIYKILMQPIPDDLPEKLRRIRSIHFLHIPIENPDLYDSLMDLAKVYGSWNSLLGAAVEVIQNPPKTGETETGDVTPKTKG